MLAYLPLIVLLWNDINVNLLLLIILKLKWGGGFVFMASRLFLFSFTAIKAIVKSINCWSFCCCCCCSCCCYESILSQKQANKEVPKTNGQHDVVEQIVHFSVYLAVWLMFIDRDGFIFEENSLSNAWKMMNREWIEWMISRSPLFHQNSVEIAWKFGAHQGKREREKIIAASQTTKWSGLLQVVREKYKMPIGFRV